MNKVSVDVNSLVSVDKEVAEKGNVKSNKSDSDIWSLISKNAIVNTQQKEILNFISNRNLITVNMITSNFPEINFSIPDFLLSLERAGILKRLSRSIYNVVH